MLIRVGAGGVFLVFGIGKFANHASELASFRAYDLPAAPAFVYVIGVLESVGGGLLILGFATTAASMLLAADMVGAIVVSGLARGERISLTLAPLLLLGMLFLVRAAPGRYALEHRDRRP